MNRMSLNKKLKEYKMSFEKVVREAVEGRTSIENLRRAPPTFPVSLF